MRQASAVLAEEEHVNHFGLEHPKRILAWSRETFGDRDALTIAVRASREVNELLIAVYHGESLESIQEEIADCAIMLWQVAVLTGLGDRRPPIQVAGLQPRRAVTRLHRRMASVIEELEWGTAPEIARAVLRDALELLEILAVHYRMNLPAAVDVKMAINRERIWEQLPGGMFQHVEAEPV